MSDDETTDSKLLRAQLERAASELDELTVARLRAGRKRAVAAAGARRTLRPAWWLPLSSAAVATLVAITFATNWWRAPSTPPLAAVDDVEILAAKDDPDFFDDIDFYDWIEAERDAS